MLILLCLVLLGGGGLYLSGRRKKRAKAKAEGSADAVLRKWGAARLKATDADHWWQRLAGRVEARQRAKKAAQFADHLVAAGVPKEKQ